MKTNILNLEDLVHKLEKDPSIPQGRKQMTKIACQYACAAMGFKELREIPVHKLNSAKSRLCTYLNSLDLKPNTRRNYKSFFARLLTWGVEQKLIHLGFQCELSKDWYALTYPIKGASSGRKGWRDALRRLGYWASTLGIETSGINSDILESYIDHLRDDSGIQAWRQIYHRTQKEWNLQFENGNLHKVEWPLLPVSKRSKYSVRLHQWPDAMQAEYQKYRSWCLAGFDLERDPKYRQRAISADQNLSNLERVVGFAKNIEGRDPSAFSMAMFFNNALIKRYINWMVEVRNGGVVRITQVRLVAQLLGMARGYFSNSEAVVWLAEIKERLEPEPVKDKRKSLISRQDLLKVPDHIRSKRLQILNRGKRDGRKVSERNQANLILQELLFRLLLERPLRQRNIREMKLGKNLIQTEKGSWLLRFEGIGMKNGKPYEISYPKSLAPLLNEYLNKYRLRLCNGADNEYVFPNPNGGHIDPRVIQRIVDVNTIETLGKHMTPHLIRDCVAYHVLKNRPEEYHMVSLILSHADVKTTLRIYGHYTPEDAGARYDDLINNLDVENKRRQAGKEDIYASPR
ncbi:MAG: tyrosine-type recombinase/integrase [FCB group bacterium]|nr:tyrosine-type recombinase/integrase [FCB group bacterium]